MNPAVYNVKVDPTINDRRREERYDIPLNATIDIVGNDWSVLQRVPALVLNISRSGACLITDLSVKPNRYIVLQIINDAFYTTAIVVAIKPAGAAVQRIHVKFLSAYWSC
jgi:hypothetical protein